MGGFMFKRLIAFMLLLSVTTSYSHAAGSGLKTALDELTYSLEVEWDQKDKAFLDARLAEFQMKLQTADAAEIQALMPANLPQSLVMELRSLEAHELSDFLMKNRNYSQGASWNALGYIAGGVAALVVLYFGIVILDSMDVTYEWK